MLAWVVIKRQHQPRASRGPANPVSPAPSAPPPPYSRLNFQLSTLNCQLFRRTSIPVRCLDLSPLFATATKIRFSWRGHGEFMPLSAPASPCSLICVVTEWVPTSKQSSRNDACTTDWPVSSMSPGEPYFHP